MHIKSRGFISRKFEEKLKEEPKIDEEIIIILLHAFVKISFPCILMECDYITK